MKRNLMCAVLAGVLVLTAGCGNQGDSGSGHRIEPLPSALNVDELDNCTFFASFEAEDEASANGVNTLYVTVYDYEKFDLVDVAQMGEGDTLVIDGKEVLVESVERDDDGRVIINGGSGEGGHDLCTDESTVYYEVTVDAEKNYYPIGETLLVLDSGLIFTDDADPADPGSEYDLEGFVSVLQEGDYGFTSRNTTITIEDSRVTNIHRAFMP